MDALSQLTARFRRNPSQLLADQIMKVLLTSQIYVPVALGKNDQAAANAPDAFGLKPDVIPVPGGRVIFPVFSNQAQITEAYGREHTFLHIPFSRFCAAAVEDPRLMGIVIDPFTSKFMLEGPVCRNLSIIASQSQ